MSYFFLYTIISGLSLLLVLHVLLFPKNYNEKQVGTCLITIGATVFIFSIFLGVFPLIFQKPLTCLAFLTAISLAELLIMPRIFKTFERQWKRAWSQDKSGT